MTILCCIFERKNMFRFRFIFLLSATAIFVSCNNKGETPDDSNVTYLSEQDTNTLKIGDSATISISYPQGTNFYRYELSDSLHLVQEIGHETRPGNPDEAGGAMGESFTVKAVHAGNTTIHLTDKSGGAAKMFNKDSTLVNHRAYILHIIE